MALLKLLSAHPEELSALGALGASLWVLYLVDLSELNRT